MKCTQGVIFQVLDEVQVGLDGLVPKQQGGVHLLQLRNGAVGQPVLQEARLERQQLVLLRHHLDNQSREYLSPCRCKRSVLHCQPAFAAISS